MTMTANARDELGHELGSFFFSAVRLLVGLALAGFLWNAVLDGVIDRGQQDLLLAGQRTIQAAQLANLPLSKDDANYSGGVRLTDLPAPIGPRVSDEVVAAQALASYYSEAASEEQTWAVFVGSGVAGSLAIAISGLAVIKPGMLLSRRMWRRWQRKRSHWAETRRKRRASSSRTLRRNHRRAETVQRALEIKASNDLAAHIVERTHHPLTPEPPLQSHNDSRDISSA